jgi:hypothetical protein
MDQVKEYVRLAIKYRFWIAVGLSALLPLIAYFVGVGAVVKAAADQTSKVTTAHKGAKEYTSGTPINNQYSPVVVEKTGELSTDVDHSWRKLYARQAPLLRWPQGVHDRFTKWGRKWPEGVDSSQVNLTIDEYVEAYPKFVTEVYKTFNPFDPMEGTGVVSAPSEEILLHPAKFDRDKLPPLGKVWDAQERLWVQGTLLDVIAQVNKDAKTWDQAIVRQINLLEVGTPSAQDQRSMANGEALKEAEAIDDPAKPKAEDTSAAAGPGGAGGPGTPMAGYAAMMGGGSGMMGGSSETVSYIDSGSTQFKIMPVRMTVLVDQARIQDFLVALENSPMNIQVNEFEMKKPDAKVAKPEKGQSMNFGMMYAGYMMGERMMGGMPGYAGMGGSYGRMMSGMMMEGYGPGMGMGGGGPSRKGVDTRSKDIGKEAKAREEEVRKAAQKQPGDLYYNIVEVTVYGQARFFNAPPAETPAEPSQAQAAPAAEAPKPEAETKAEAPKAEAETKAEAPKAEPEKKDEAPKAEPEKKDEAPKAEPEKKEEAPKAEAGAPK